MSGAVYPTLPGLAFSVIRAPVWRTQIHQAVGGLETRAVLAPYPIWKYTLQYEFLRGSAAHREVQQLVDFYNQCSGSFDWFNFADPDDGQILVGSPQLIGVGDGVLTNYQLVRVLYSGGGAVEPVISPNAVNVTVDGVLKTAGVDYTVLTEGVVSFTAPPAAGKAVQWYGTYYWPCRFSDDTIDPEKFMQDLWQLKKVRFQTVRTTQ